MKNAWLICFGWLLCLTYAHCQPRQVTFELLDSAQKEASRPVVVFLHTEWCKYCEAMKNTTFVNESVTQLLDDSFYFVSFDGESRQDISFLGYTFRYKPSGNNTGVHELAEQLGTKNGRLSYPTVVFLDSRFEILYQHANYMNADDLYEALHLVLSEFD